MPYMMHHKLSKQTSLTGETLTTHMSASAPFVIHRRRPTGEMTSAQSVFTTNCLEERAHYMALMANVGLFQLVSKVANRTIELMEMAQSCEPSIDYYRACLASIVHAANMQDKAAIQRYCHANIIYELQKGSRFLKLRVYAPDANADIGDLARLPRDVIDIICEKC